MSARHARRGRRPLPQHAARPALAPRALLSLGAVVAAGLAIGSVAALATSDAGSSPSNALGGSEVSAPAPSEEPIDADVGGRPEVAESLPVPEFEATAAGPPGCGEPTMSALETGDRVAVLESFGGAENMRSAVASGRAPCVTLADASWPWVVVNKQRPLDPIDYGPSPLALPATVESLSGGELHQEAAAALDSLASGVVAATGQPIAMESGYRSFQTQQETYGWQVDTKGQQTADTMSARPGHSEHQTGFAADVVPCGPSGCATIDDLAQTPQGEWIAEHAWEHGWVVRYEEGRTGTTGYVPEPWHLRYVGPELARVYHEGGFHSLEEFWGLPPAPDYPH